MHDDHGECRNKRAQAQRATYHPGLLNGAGLDLLLAFSTTFA
jgi:hypothetical protein